MEEEAITLLRSTFVTSLLRETCEKLSHSSLLNTAAIRGLYSNDLPALLHAERGEKRGKNSIGQLLPSMHLYTKTHGTHSHAHSITPWF